LLEGVFSEKVGRKGHKAYSSGWEGGRHLDHSAFLGHWAKQRIYPFRSQMAKVEL
jgi:hypothetical protein